MFWFGILVGIVLTLAIDKLGPVIWKKLAALIGK